MRHRTLNELATTRNLVDVFKGYNHNLRIGDGEFYDMQNLTSSKFPVISPRGKRGRFAIKGTDADGKETITYPTDLLGMISKDSLGYIQGHEFYLNSRHTSGLNLDLASKADLSKTTIISMGAYVIIITRNSDGVIIDKKWVNSNDLTDFGNIEAEWSSATEASDVDFRMCTADGEAYTTDNTVVSPAAPTVTEEMEKGEADIPYWIDTSNTPHSLKQYSTTYKSWVTLPTSYVKISAPDIGMDFEVGDGVTISGIEIEQLADLNNTMVIQSKDDSTNEDGEKTSNWIVVIGIVDIMATQSYLDEDGKTHPVKVERRMPHMDFITESENRLWGCRYGMSRNGEMVNEIYASKLGDFKNWNVYSGITTDSYAATVGTDGAFTGAITHLGYPLFFKENCIHKVYGSYPANYQITTTNGRGVQKGSHKSLAIVNETLYYKSRTAVCAYDGSLPTEISYAFGETQYSEAVAGWHGNKYYISMQDNGTSLWHLFVYDTAKGLWHREDNTRAIDFCTCRGELYYIDGADKQIKTMFGSGVTDNTPVKWWFETGLIGCDSPDYKYISRLTMRVAFEVGTRVIGYIQYDSVGTWIPIFNMVATSLRSVNASINLRRCDHFRLRVEGEGDAQIFSIAKTIEDGSEFR